MLELGPFELIQPIGRGGMCEVWRGEHRTQRTPVAVKVVLDNHTRPERYMRTFRDEVRAMAGLQHPSIVRVYDYGQIPEKLAERSGGRLAPHSPYLIMELGDDSLRPSCGNLDWSSLYKVLLSLLDALSHAHAKGVIHRDIKPGNVLLCGGQRIKLTDFGLAHAMGWDYALEDTGEIIGTPSYMAPEQFERRWRDFGPWTDLYALGCTTYALITGEPPFGRLDSLEEMMRSHLYRPIPRLPAHCAVPPYFDQWLRCLLAKSPTARFQRAADAAWALFELTREWKAPPVPISNHVSVASEHTLGSFQHSPKPMLQSASTPLQHSLQALSPGPSQEQMFTQNRLAPKNVDRPGIHLDSGPLHNLYSLNEASTIRAQSIDLTQAPQQVTQQAQRPPMEETLRLQPGVSSPPRASRSPEFQKREPTVRLSVGPSENAPSYQVMPESPSPLFHRPPLVEDWRRPDLARPVEMLHNVGLGLYDLRTIPWAGRDHERDQLWQCLLRVCRKKQPQLAVLHGPSGSGKSRLAEWLGERSHEVGTALPLHVSFGPNDEHHDAFASMMTRYLSCAGLPYEECLERLLHGEGHRLGLAQSECEALATWLAPDQESLPSGEMPVWSMPSSIHPSSIHDTMEARILNPEDFASTALGPVPLVDEDSAVWDITNPMSKPAGFSDEPIQPRHRLSDPSLRYGLLLQVLQRLAHRRPLILWLDDVHWSPDALYFIKHLLIQNKQADFPLLVVLTTQDDIIAERHTEQALLLECMQTQKATSIEVGPLPDKDHSRLVRTLLGLQGELAQAVESHTAGNPLFAVQIVGDWVQRGLLETTHSGFRLKPNVEITIPDSLHQVWKARLERILESHPRQVAMILEMAAVLGHQVNKNEWLAVCQIVGEPLPLRLFEQLLEQRLVRRTSAYSEDWSFAHAMLRESLQRQAQEARRLETHHWVCAIMLARKKGRGIAERQGRHLQQAGRLEDALSPLLEGIWEREEAGEYRLAEPLLAQWEALLERIQLPQEHAFWGEHWLLKSRVARGYGDYERAFKMAHIAYKDALHHKWERIHSLSLTLLAHCGLRCGQDVNDVEAWLLEAESLAQRLEDTQLLAEACWAMGEFLCLRGQWSEASQRFQQAHQNYTTRQDAFGMGRSHYGLATVARQGDYFEQAQHHLELAQRHFEACQCQRGIADCLNMLGDLCRIRGQLAPAEENYRESISIYKAIGAGDNAVCEVNLALVLLLRSNFTEARLILESSIATFTQNSSRMLEGAAHICLLPCLAHTKEWDDWEHHVSTARELLQSSNFYDVDIAEVAFLAGKMAEREAAFSQAKEAYDIALHQWDVLEHPEKAEHVQQCLLQLQRMMVQTPTIRNRIPSEVIDFTDPNAPTQRSTPSFEP